jgi:exodeoxyribonuclease VII small subunit
MHLKGAGMSEDRTFEQALKNLEEAVARLEKGQMPLDEALDCFEAGVQSANLCRKKLQAVEKRIEILIKGAAGELQAEPFPDRVDQD